MARKFMKGTEAIAEAAIRAGCDCFFGYPITPQSEVAASSSTSPSTRRDTSSYWSIPR